MDRLTQRMEEVVREAPLDPALSRRLFLTGAARAAGLLGVAGALGTLAGTKSAEAAGILSSTPGGEFDYVPPFNPQAKYKATFAHDSGPRSAYDFYGKYLQCRLTVLTRGEISINLVGASALGAADATAKSVRAGTMEIAGGTGAIMGGIISPEFAIFDLPYLLTSYGHFLRVVYSSPFLTKLHDVGLSKGVKMLSCFNGGLRHIFYKGSKAILEPADLKGTKLRTQPAPLDVAMWTAAGAQATPISYAEVYNALQQGVVDGLDNTFQAATSIKLDELVKNASLTAHRYQVNFLFVSLKYFNSLPKEYQDYLVQAGVEGSIYSIGSVIMEEEGRLPTLWARQGIRILMPNRKAFEEAMVKVYPEFVPKLGGQENVDAVRKLG